MKKSTENKKDYNRQYMEDRRRSAGVPTAEDVRIRYYTQFLINSAIIHNNKYQYHKVKYKTGQLKVVISCPLHGDFLQTPGAHLRGQGCPKCAQVDRLASRKRKSQDQFVNEANQVHNYKYTYSSPYVNLITKVDINCPDHGIFTQTPKAHLRGQGCPMCANERRLSFFQSAGETDIENYLLTHQIVYEKQKMFDECIRIGRLRYDFYLPDYNTLIEFDGEQHFKFVKKFHRTDEGFKVFQERDHIKDQFAADNDIKLLRISYIQQCDISTILDNALYINTPKIR